MFVVTKEPQFTHTVQVMVPCDGGHEKQDFKCTFRVMTTEKFKAAGYDFTNGVSVAEFLRSVIVSFDDLVGQDEKPLPYSDTLRDQLIDLPYVRQALSDTYFEALNKAGLGN